MASLVGCPSYMYRGGISLAADFILYPEKGEHVMGARRLGVVLLGAVMAVTLLVVLVVGAVPEKADAAPRFRVLIIKKTFTSDQQITFPSGGAAASYPSEKNASGFRKGKIRDVNLTLEKFSHRIPDDVDVMLSHRGVNRTVMSDIGGALLVNNMTLRLDDEAAALLPDNGPLLGGAFRPLNASTGGIDSFPSSAPTPSGLANLSGFDGKNPKGPWKLWVVDDTPNLDGGEFDGGWSITIKVKAKVRRSR